MFLLGDVGSTNILNLLFIVKNYQKKKIKLLVAREVVGDVFLHRRKFRPIYCSGVGADSTPSPGAVFLNVDLR